MTIEAEASKMMNALARLGEAAQASGKALHELADQVVHDLEVELSATPGWRWLKRRRLTRRLSKARYQYAVLGIPPVGVYSTA